MSYIVFKDGISIIHGFISECLKCSIVFSDGNSKISNSRLKVRVSKEGAPLKLYAWNVKKKQVSQYRQKIN